MPKQYWWIFDIDIFWRDHVSDIKETQKNLIETTLHSEFY